MDNISSISAAPAWFLLIVVVGLIAFDCRRDIRQLVSARNVFLLTIMAWFLLEACLMPVAVQMYDQSAHLIALTAVGLCVVGFLGGYVGTRGGLFDGLFCRLVSIDSPKVNWGVFVLAVVIGFLPDPFLPPSHDPRSRSQRRPPEANSYQRGKTEMKLPFEHHLSGKFHKSKRHHL